MANHTFNAGKILPDNILIQKLRQAAKVYQNYADLDVLIVYAKTKEGPFHYYQFHAGIENFQHLAGIKSHYGVRPTLILFTSFCNSYGQKLIRFLYLWI